MADTQRSNTHRLDLPVLLPDIPDARDACVQRLTSSLRGHEGIARVHVVAAQNGTPDQLCIHYDPDVIPLSRIRQRAKSLGAELTDRFRHLTWRVRGIRHVRQARTAAHRLREHAGIIEADVSASGQVRIEYDRSVTTEDAIRTVLDRMDLQVVVEASPDASLAEDARAAQDATGAPDAEAERGGHDHAHDHGGVFGERTELIFALTSGVVLALGFALSYVGSVPSGVSLALYVAAYGFGGYYTVRDAYDTLRAGRFEVDTLMLVAAAGAAVLGKWAEGAFLLFLFATGHALEHYAMERARTAIASLADLAPETARVRRDGTEQEVPVDELRKGDTVIVRTNERVPADGIVTKGESEVNQAPVTGESIPVDKRPVDDPEAA
ncbi:MAG: heavy metal translocating P-type ATPase, partial [Bacteroidetes bacterium]|nr:heavy metal translocating P-type ATPase [Bacteroidota bacterium]